MLLKDFVTAVLEKIKDLPCESRDPEILVQFENYVSFETLKKLLEQYSESTVEINQDSLEPFIHFLKGYDLVLMTDCQPTKGQFHVRSDENDSLLYSVITPAGIRVTDRIEKAELQEQFGIRYSEFSKVLEEQDLAKLAPFFTDILQITTKRGHTCLGRWQVIQDTDSIPSYNLSPANKAAIVLAKELSQHLHIPFYQLMIPTLHPSVFETNDNNLNMSNMVPQQFVMSDDNDRPIDILHCLENAKKSSGELIHNFPIQGKKNELTETEKSRIKYHSCVTHNYYLLKDEKQITRKRNKLFYALKDDHYKLLASYGKPGYERLKSRISINEQNREYLVEFITKRLIHADWKRLLNFMSMKNLFEVLTHLNTLTHDKVVEIVKAQNRDEIIKQLAAKIPDVEPYLHFIPQDTLTNIWKLDNINKPLLLSFLNIYNKSQLVELVERLMRANCLEVEWDTVVKCIGDNFCKYMLRNELGVMQTWDFVLQDRSNYKKDNDWYNRAFLFCMSEVYRINRDAFGDYKGLGLFGPFFGDSKGTKFNAVTLKLRPGLTHKTLLELDKELQEPSPFKHALTHGDLSAIPNQIHLMVQPDYFKEKPVSQVGLGG